MIETDFSTMPPDVLFEKLKDIMQLLTDNTRQKNEALQTQIDLEKKNTALFDTKRRIGSILNKKFGYSLDEEPPEPSYVQKVAGMNRENIIKLLRGEK